MCVFDVGMTGGIGSHAPPISWRASARSLFLVFRFFASEFSSASNRPLPTAPCHVPHPLPACRLSKKFTREINPHMEYFLLKFHL